MNNNDEILFDITKAVCFSGHRPHKLPGGGDPGDKRTVRIKYAIHRAVLRSINEGYYIFLSGLAEGIDLWASEEVIKMKETHPDINLASVKNTLDSRTKLVFDHKERPLILFSNQFTLDYYMQKHPDIKLVAVKPMQNQGANFSPEGKRLLEHALENADYIVCTSEHYSKYCYTIRNKYMVDHSDRLIAFISKSSTRSGTNQTINYAKKIHKKTTVINVDHIVSDSCQLSLYY